MAVIIDIDHEANNLDEYSATETDGGKLSVAAAAALAGTNYGLSVAIDDTDGKYAQIDASGAKSTLRYRVYVDPNSISMPNPASIWFIRHQNTSNQLLMQCRLYYDGTNYSIRPIFYNDAGSSVLSDSKNVTDAPHYVEFEVVSATTNSSADGTVEWWVDGASEGSAASVDNYNRMQDAAGRFRLGAQDITASVSGTIYIDQLVVNDDGGEIGPYVAPAGVTASQMFIFTHLLSGGR
jgi:hypothetical protein